MTTGTAKWRESLAPLRLRPFRYQFGAQAISMIGNTLTPVALSIGVLAVTGRIGALGAVLAAYTVPLVVFVLVGGVWADRLPRQQVMIAADLIRAVTQCGAGALLVLGHAEVWPYVVLQFFTGAAAAFYHPASTGLTAVTVPSDQVQQANAFLSLTRSISGSLGPLCASILVLTVGAGWALIIDGVSFVGSALLLARIAIPPRAVRAERQSFVKELAVGFREVRTRSWVWSSIFAFAFSNLSFAALFVLGPALLVGSEQGILTWGLVVGVISVGQIVGNVLALRWRPQRLLLTARIVELAQIPLLAALALFAPMPLLLAGAFLCGIGVTYPDALWLTAMQQHLPEQALSRVSSYDWMGSLVLRPFGYAASAAVAAGAGLTNALLIAAVLIGGTRLGSMFLPSVRNLRRLAPSSAENT